MNLAHLITLIQNGVASGLVPESVEYSKIGDLYWVNVVQQSTDALISDRVFTGFDVDYATALSKAISEKIEREAFQAGLDQGVDSCQTKRSDGFAAYPRFLSNPETKVREAALNEAIERYVWATWWDDTEIKFDHQILDPSELGLGSPLFEDLQAKLKINRLHLISPRFSRFSEKEALIFVAELENGVLTGGACGDRSDRQGTILRGMAELYRHGLVLVQNKKMPAELSFYEQRLLFLASSKGLENFNQRLAIQGSKEVILPDFAFDEVIPHANSKTHLVHRCLFKNQPPFVGGDLERMCL